MLARFSKIHSPFQDLAVHTALNTFQSYNNLAAKTRKLPPTRAAPVNIDRERYPYLDNRVPPIGLPTSVLGLLLE
jgi:hypothetical protein